MKLKDEPRAPVRVRKFTARRAQALTDELGNYLPIVAAMLPHLAEQARHERDLPHGHRMPQVAEELRCTLAECDGSPHDGLGRHAEQYDTGNEMDADDPVGEKVANLRPSPADTQLATAEASIRAYLAVMERLRALSLELFAQAPAMTAAVRARCDARDGRTEEERLMELLAARSAEPECLVCDRPRSTFDTTTVVLGQEVLVRAWLRHGLCPDDHTAWDEAGRPPLGIPVEFEAVGEDGEPLVGKQGQPVYELRWPTGWVRDQRAAREPAEIIEGPWGAEPDAGQVAA